MAKEDHPMWRKPQHHMDSEHVHDHVHWTELFYDLVHVVTIFMLGNYLSHHLTPVGFAAFVAMFTALWLAWGDISVYNSLYITTDYQHRLAMSLQICTVMFMAAAIPAIDGKGWPYFAMAYAVNRLIVAQLYLRAKRSGSDHSNIPTEMCRNFVVLSIIAAVSAFLPAPYNYYLFTVGVLCTVAIYSLPGLSIMRYERFVPRLGHIVERFALLVLIVLGESFFKLVVTLSEKGIYKVGPDILVNFVIGGIATFFMCWLYFDFIGNAKPKDTKPTTMTTLWLGHLFLMIGGTMVGVALAGEVKVGFFEPFPIKYAWMGCLGLALYLAMLQVLQQVVEPREAHRFSDKGIRGFGILMAFITLMAVPYVPTIIGNILWGTALFSQALIPLYRAWTTISKEEGW